MNTGIIASRYADALLKYVKETGEGGVVFRQTEILEEALRTSPELVRFLESPALLQATAKVALLQKALGEEKMAASLEKFLLLVIRQDRIPYLRYILHYFRMRWCESIGVSPAKLVVSTPSPGLEERIKGIFNDFTGRRLSADSFSRLRTSGLMQASPDSWKNSDGNSSKRMDVSSRKRK